MDVKSVVYYDFSNMLLKINNYFMFTILMHDIVCKKHFVAEQTRSEKTIAHDFTSLVQSLTFDNIIKSTSIFGYYLSITNYHILYPNI